MSKFNAKAVEEVHFWAHSSAFVNVQNQGRKQWDIYSTSETGKHYIRYFNWVNIIVSLNDLPDNKYII